MFFVLTVTHKNIIKKPHTPKSNIDLMVTHGSVSKSSV